MGPPRKLFARLQSNDTLGHARSVVVRWGHCEEPRAAFHTPMTPCACLQSVNFIQSHEKYAIKFSKELIAKMNFTQFSLKLFGAAGIATATLLDAAPSKAVLYLDFIPLSPTKTRIQSSGSLNTALLGAWAAGSNTLDASGNNSSRIGRGFNDFLNFTYNPTSTSVAGRRYSFSGTTNPFTGSGNVNWTGTTPANNPPLILRFTNQDLWLPTSYTSGAAINGFFDVNLSLAAIGLSSPIISLTSGTEQIILRDFTTVPGPVPLLGAAAAFGYSRKLRNRIQKSTLKRTA